MLRSLYRLSKGEILRAFSRLLESAELEIEGEPSVEQALFIWKDSAAEFADWLIRLPRDISVGRA